MEHESFYHGRYVCKKCGWKYDRYNIRKGEQRVCHHCFTFNSALEEVCAHIHLTLQLPKDTTKSDACFMFFIRLQAETLFSRIFVIISCLFDQVNQLKLNFVYLVVKKNIPKKSVKQIKNLR